jgi:hypothetical protein
MSEESDQLVKEMCKDIKDLDTAKKNLDYSINAITKFNSIYTTFKQL